MVMLLNTSYNKILEIYNKILETSCKKKHSLKTRFIMTCIIYLYFIIYLY